MTLIVKRKFQVIDHSGVRPKFLDLEPGTYPGRVGSPPPKYDKSSAWFYVNGRTAIGAALNYLRGQAKDLVELLEA
jgi:hypothetical protein